MANKKRKKTKQRKLFKRICGTLLVVVLIYFLYCLFSSYNVLPEEFDDLLQVHYINVDQGDATLLIEPDGNTMLIDTGKAKHSSELLNYLSILGVDELDYLVITHYHDDHMGGAEDVFEKLYVKNVILLDITLETSAYKSLMSSVYAEESTILYANQGDEYDFGDADFTILGPKEITDDGKNDDSIMIKVIYENSSFLFTGDAEKRAESEAIDSMGADIFDCDVLQAGHHGSRTSSSDKFLDAVSPMCVVISCGVDNDYNHPHQETIQKYDDRGIIYYRTDIDDDILILSDGETISKWSGKLENPYYRFKEWLIQNILFLAPKFNIYPTYN